MCKEIQINMKLLHDKVISTFKMEKLLGALELHVSH